MLLGFISLLLTVLQETIIKICIPPSWTDNMLPCQRPVDDHAAGLGVTKASFIAAEILGGIRPGRLLSEEEAAKAQAGICQKEGKVPLLSLEALHQLHIFIFVLAVSHVFFSATTMLLGGAKIRKWKQWEDEIKQNTAENGPIKVTHVHQLEFIKERYKGIGKDSMILCWLLLLAVGTKLEHVISELAYDVAEKHIAIEGDLVVNPSDEHFWFGQPRIVLHLIHFILFQNAFELAFFFYILMGSYYKKEIFNEHVQHGVLGWAQKAKGKKCLKECNSI
ncbi:hypothetical protein EJB05_35552 [Eragrostis curvula]|uniref:MLO-like protein n=1 Tax=Eragrostis curvula TaxID=38414 RepID=A0A5J9U773_9POAL|nr:hypothetical protein EJB05_35552 [Eragrostis curvula]